MCLASIVMIHPVSPGITDFSASQPDVTHSTPPADRLLAGEPQHVVSNFFTDTGARFFAGVWESTKGAWKVRYTENEFCHITKGKVRIRDESGQSWEFAAGSSFVIPSGFVGRWEVLEPTKKVYAIYEPAP
jgi:uncharacterized cupin superfamily protein